MNDIGSWLLARLREPSTWAGIATGATAIGHLMAGDPSDVLKLFTAIAGLGFSVVAVVLKEKSGGAAS